MIALVIGLLGSALALGLPGWLLARLLTDGDPLWRGVFAAALALFGVPALAFGVGLAFGTSVTVPLLLTVGLATSAPLALLVRHRERE